MYNRSDKCIRCVSCPFLEYSTLKIGMVACIADQPPYFSSVGTIERRCRFNHSLIQIKAFAYKTGLDRNDYGRTMYVFYNRDGLRSRFFGSPRALNDFLKKKKMTSNEVYMLYLDKANKVFYRQKLIGTFPRQV